MNLACLVVLLSDVSFRRHKAAFTYDNQMFHFFKANGRDGLSAKALVASHFPYYLARVVQDNHSLVS